MAPRGDPGNAEKAALSLAEMPVAVAGMYAYFPASFGHPEKPP
jgi:hypothetical protein